MGNQRRRPCRLVHVLAVCRDYGRPDRIAFEPLERDDDEGLVVLGGAVAGELAHGVEQGLLDLLGGEVPGLGDGVLEAVEAERLAIVVDRFDQAVAIEDEPVPGRELDRVLAEGLAALDSEGEAPGRQRLRRRRS